MTEPIPRAELATPTPAQAEFKPSFVPEVRSTDTTPTPRMSEISGKATGEFLYTAKWKELRREAGESTEDYEGRRPIERDTKVSGGVSTGNYKGEAIVVDNAPRLDNKGLVTIEPYQELLQEAISRAQGKSQGDPEVDILRGIYDTVASKIKYSSKGVDRVLAAIAKQHGLKEFVKGTKVALTSFIRAGVGECRHQALAEAAVAEMAKNQGLLRGEISYDRNVNWVDKDKPDGHAWMRYTAPNGEIYILDVAQGYFGKLADTRTQKTWNYYRGTPDEARSDQIQDARQSVNSIHRAAEVTAAQATNTGLIDFVPQTTEDFAKLDAQSRREANAPIREAITLLEHRRIEIESQLPADELNVLVTYAMAVVRTRAAQLRGDRDESRHQQKIAGPAFSKLSPAADKYARQYIEILQETSRLADKLK